MHFIAKVEQEHNTRKYSENYGLGPEESPHLRGASSVHVTGSRRRRWCWCWWWRWRSVSRPMTGPCGGGDIRRSTSCCIQGAVHPLSRQCPLLLQALFALEVGPYRERLELFNLPIATHTHMVGFGSRSRVEGVYLSHVQFHLIFHPIALFSSGTPGISIRQGEAT